MRLTAISLLIIASSVAAPADDRAADRDAIRAHIESIYRAYITKDKEAVRATHDAGWQGFLEGSNRIIRGIDDYMNVVKGGLSSPYGMSSVKIRDFDAVFQGDAAFVSFIADVEANWPGAVPFSHRISDFYVKKDGKWNQAGSNTTLTPDSTAEQYQRSNTMSDGWKKRLLEAREAVWRAWFSNDRAALERLLPAETVAIDPSGSDFSKRAAIFESAAQFAKSGAKLTRLEFPKTEIQSYGYTAFVYSTYMYELERDGSKSQHSGRVTEIFVEQKGAWVNPGWHMDEMKQ